MLQCVAVCCSVLQRVVVCCSVLQCVEVCCSVLQRVVVCYSLLQCVAVCCSVLQYVTACCSVLQSVAGYTYIHRNTSLRASYSMATSRALRRRARVIFVYVTQARRRMTSPGTHRIHICTLHTHIKIKIVHTNTHTPKKKSWNDFI